MLVFIASHFRGETLRVKWNQITDTSSDTTYNGFFLDAAPDRYFNALDDHKSACRAF
jgi:hypothetical protein